MAASSEFETGYHLSLSNVVRIPWGWGVGKLVGNTQSSVSSESRELSIPFLKQIWSLFLTETWNSPLLCCHHPIARHSSTLCDTCVGEHLLLSPLSDPQHPSWQSSLSVQARWPTYPVCFLPGHWHLFISRLFPSLPCWFWDHPHQSSSSFISDTILGFLSICQTSNSTMYSKQCPLHSAPGWMSLQRPILWSQLSVLMSRLSQHWDLIYVPDSWSLHFLTCYQHLYGTLVEPKGCAEIWTILCKYLWVSYESVLPWGKIPPWTMVLFLIFFVPISEYRNLLEK